MSIQPFQTSHVFKAPRQLLFELYSQTEHQLALLGPAGSSNVYSKLDFRVGGTHHYAMDAGGSRLWGMQTFLEIVPGEKIVLLQSFSDKDGGIAAHPAAPTWPKQMHATMAFADAPGGQSQLTVTWLPHQSDAAGEATFDGARQGMTGGFKQQFEQMDAYLAKIQA